MGRGLRSTGRQDWPCTASTGSYGCGASALRLGGERLRAAQRRAPFDVLPPKKWPLDPVVRTDRGRERRGEGRDGGQIRLREDDRMPEIQAVADAAREDQRFDPKRPAESSVRLEDGVRNQDGASERE